MSRKAVIPFKWVMNDNIPVNFKNFLISLYGCDYCQMLADKHAFRKPQINPHFYHFYTIDTQRNSLQLRLQKASLAVQDFKLFE